MRGQVPREMPPSLGGGTVSIQALKLTQREEFKGVPQPDLIAECVVRLITRHDEKARNGLRGVISYYKQANRYGKLVHFLEKIYTHGK